MRDIPMAIHRSLRSLWQQGKLLGENLLQLTANKFTRPFVYRDKGRMAIISKYKAVVDLNNGSFKGGFAWLLWLLIHIIPLVNFRNRIKVFLNWSLSFVTSDVALRLIFRPEISHIPVSIGQKKDA